MVGDHLRRDQEHLQRVDAHDGAERGDVLRGGDDARGRRRRRRFTRDLRDFARLLALRRREIRGIRRRRVRADDRRRASRVRARAHRGAGENGGGRQGEHVLSAGERTVRVDERRGVTTLGMRENYNRADAA